MTEKYQNFSDLTFYQIYPRSFCDSNGDGMGDLRGITSKIPYLKELGIDAVWISPFYKSPGNDGGYDISDYRAIQEEFGTMEDFREMLGAMHASGIKVIVDFVPNHTSTEHFWFREARKSKDNPYRDFYIWADKPRNDWVACCESAWKYDEVAGQYYLHCFDPTQADLNWENPRVRKEMCDVLDFWVDMGVDGFRCDVIDMISKDWENNRVNKGPHLHEYINELFGREKMAHVFTVGECWGANVENIRNLTGADRGELTTVFQFEHINRNCRARFEPKDFSLSEFGEIFAKWQKITQENDLLYTLFIENHDLGRCISRFANDSELRYESATMFATMLYGMRGIPFIYQGQEIGVTNSYFEKIEDFDDMETTAFYRAYKDVLSEEELWRLINFGSRDNARRPMAWNAGKNGGFSSGEKMWLTLHPDYEKINVEADKASEKSIFRYFKDIIALRKANAVLRRGTFENLTSDAKNYFMYRREYNGEELIVVCNFDKESHIALPTNLTRLMGNYPEHENCVFAPYESAIYKVVK
ncbi:MAG: alpha-glucosidase [Clostridia bacterium]|nr:alpha-glucosidase [Clostridia bacterium]